MHIGDQLAQGARQATFYPESGPGKTKNKVLTVKKDRKLWGECAACGHKVYSVREFSDHVGRCNG